jgi:hypothetical protein
MANIKVGVKISMSQLIKANKSGNVGNKKRMSTDAVLYKNGLLNIETSSQSKHPTEGLRGHVLVICVDDASKAIWVSKDYKCTTRGGRLDPFCASAGTNAWQEQFPEAVGQHTTSLNIVHSEEGLGNVRNNILQAIKTYTEISQEIATEIKKLGI